MPEARRCPCRPPPEMEIHQVSCASSELTVSLHVYGADIAELGSSHQRRLRT
ncbi:MAG: hypothetical protein ACRDQ5_10415 [Sciscionella sp.]